MHAIVNRIWNKCYHIYMYQILHDGLRASGKVAYYIVRAIDRIEFNYRAHN